MPHVNLLALREAAAAMHRIKRFCGKFESALSVLEHTNLATLLALESGEDRVAPLVLLHDVSEVYFSDLPYTLKNGSPWCVISITPLKARSRTFTCSATVRRGFATLYQLLLERS